MASVYSPVYSAATGWVVGMIEDHSARPLRESEVKAACNILINAGTDRAALHEAVGVVADRLDNLIAAMALPVPATTHLAGLRGSLPDIVAELRAAITAAQDGGDRG